MHSMNRPNARGNWREIRGWDVAWLICNTPTTWMMRLRRVCKLVVWPECLCIIGNVVEKVSNNLRPDVGHVLAEAPGALLASPSGPTRLLIPQSQTAPTRRAEALLERATRWCVFGGFENVFYR
jgi:hypothetical protein